MKTGESFYLNTDVVKVARNLLGKMLCTKIDKKITTGMIVETEAYSQIEKGSHAYKGMTTRNQVMFEPGGKSYVYLCYGIHHMFNVVTNEKDAADAVLIRALQPMNGIDHMMKRMNTQSPLRITSGPGKLAKALGIDRSFNGKDLGGNEIWIEDGESITSKMISASPRIGIDYAKEDAMLPWRFTISNNEWVSRK